VRSGNRGVGSRTLAGNNVKIGKVAPVWRKIERYFLKLTLKRGGGAGFGGV
jgi:hypothetical protein